MTTTPITAQRARELVEAARIAEGDEWYVEDCGDYGTQVTRRSDDETVAIPGINSNVVPLLAAVRDMRDAEHALGVMRMEEDESPGSVCEHEHTRVMDRRDHLTAELYELAGLRESTGMTRLAYAEKIMREFVAAADALNCDDGHTATAYDDALAALREAAK